MHSAWGSLQDKVPEDGILPKHIAQCNILIF
jgi:hypothetical protein